MSSNSTWRLSFWPVLAFACILPLLLALGAWQVQRGVEKQAAYARFDKAVSSGAMNVNDLALEAFNRLPAYERIQVQGHYLEERHFLLDNMPRNGRPGHHVLTPFQPQNAEYLIMVDRGWRPGLAPRSTGEPAGIPRNTHEVTGMLATFPQPALQLAGKPEYEGWPRVAQFPTAGELSEALGTPVASRRLLLDENAAEGYQRDWSPPGIAPARHFAYAFQWFGLAIALIVIFIVMARPRRSKDERK